jgi:hypothetical protein
MVQFWNLQVVRARHFRDQAENNRSRLVTLAAPRGRARRQETASCWSATGRPFSVLLVPEHAENLDRVSSGSPRRSGWARPRFASGWRGASPTGRSVIKNDATLADIAVLDARRRELPEVSVEVVPAALLPARQRRRSRARARRRDHRAPAAARRVQEPAARRASSARLGSSRATTAS